LRQIALIGEHPHMRASRTRLAVAVAVILVSSHAVSAPSQARQSPLPAVTIDSPRDREKTNERTAVVMGRAPVAPPGGEVSVTVTVNGRPVDVEPRRERFRVAVVLELGVNRISANADIYGPGTDDMEPATVTAQPIEVTRVRGPDTGVLNLATALWVANDSRDVYWLCGEADGCLADPVCIRMGRSRVDCPVKSQYQPDEPQICGVVVSVQVRARRVYSYSYRCEGRWHRNSRRFVRPEIQRAGRRYRVNEHESDWFIEEVNERNSYGLPRFDVVRDRFIP
jgi:Glucodextranase, domain B